MTSSGEDFSIERPFRINTNKNDIFSDRRKQISNDHNIQSDYNNVITKQKKVFEIPIGDRGKEQF